ncbi:ankyrin repeat domain-containing protein [Comamonas sp. NLF-1-9]|uniref:ankyrin repeat domain-containing protein n=1 Tax=Comamonas sp. NLF-1-9 TaxID=2853163 RepID=UPI001C43EC99|nr:ankyrin repeat domain-containing protein [Comamonas sp. NLF-1-9]QXL83162.1 ankyrin repeat domain-containing protein [Comamonas sp. NLF-1-9]
MRRRALLLAGAALAGAQVHAGAWEDFFQAIELDDERTVASLLRRGFDPNARDARRQPAITVALFKDSRKAAAVLLASRRLQVEARNAKDESPLMMAAMRGNLQAARTLIARDADVNKTGWTPLHYAASSSADSAADMVRLLLEHAAYIDAGSPNGSTPLMMAAQYGQIDVARLLLAEGADPSIKNQQGLSALDFARKAERDGLVQDIVRAMQRQRPNKGQW